MVLPCCSLSYESYEITHIINPKQLTDEFNLIPGCATILQTNLFDFIKLISELTLKISLRSSSLCKVSVYFPFPSTREFYTNMNFNYSLNNLRIIHNK